MSARLLSAEMKHGNAVRLLRWSLVSLLVVSNIAVAQQMPNAEIEAAKAWVLPQNPLAKMPVVLGGRQDAVARAWQPKGVHRGAGHEHSSVPDWWPQDHPPMPEIVARSGAATLPMQAVVAKLTVDDMIALAAYAASRTP